jgi:sulfiredoxin
MMKTKVFPLGSIYVPVKRRASLDPGKVKLIAESIMEVGQQVPILVRQDGARLVLVEGLHRLEACRSLGEESILGYLVEARRH